MGIWLEVLMPFGFLLRVLEGCKRMLCLYIILAEGSLLVAEVTVGRASWS
jgi:hypothetical protein